MVSRGEAAGEGPSEAEAGQEVACLASWASLERTGGTEGSQHGSMEEQTVYSYLHQLVKTGSLYCSVSNTTQH